MFYARSAIHLSDEELDEFFKKLVPSLKEGAYIMIEGKTMNDTKVQRSLEVAANLYRDIDGHLRRLWTEENVEDFTNKFNLKLLQITNTLEYWNNVEARFINFIAQK